MRRQTEEETELIRKILSRDKEEFQRFLMADGVYPYKETIWISAYDFTGDGIDEILVSKYYVDMSAELTYNYVYDQIGRRVRRQVLRGSQCSVTRRTMDFRSI